MPVAAVSRIISVCQSFYGGVEDTTRWCWKHLWREVECDECGGDDQECLEYVGLLMSETKICDVIAKSVEGR